MAVEKGKKPKLTLMRGGRHGGLDMNLVPGQYRPPTPEEWAVDMREIGMPEYVVTLGKSSLPALPARRDRNGC